MEAEAFNKNDVGHLINTGLSLIPRNCEISKVVNQIVNWHGKNKDWEIAMHGYTHVDDKLCKKSDDYFNYGGGSEFFGHSLETQTSKIKNGLTRIQIQKMIQC